MISQALERCIANNFLNDKRFAEIFIKSQISKKYGPMRISANLQKKGITQEIINNALAETACDWVDLAKSNLSKKFKSSITSAKEKNRRIRYLLAQGFYYEHVKSALNLDEWESEY